ncbi:hypothetical protein D3C72_2018870 [compost metagenome]
MYQHVVGTKLGEYFSNILQNIGRDRIQILVRAHDIKVKIGRDIEQVKYLIEHLPVLRRDANLAIDVRM